MLYYFIRVDVHSLINWEMKGKGIGLCLKIKWNRETRKKSLLGLNGMSENN